MAAHQSVAKVLAPGSKPSHHRRSAEMELNPSLFLGQLTMLSSVSRGHWRGTAEEASPPGSSMDLTRPPTQPAPTVPDCHTSWLQLPLALRSQSSVTDCFQKGTVPPTALSTTLEGRYPSS